MRTYGRTKPDINGNRTWVVVETDDAGHNDAVWVTTLCQVLLLSPNEDPFFANYGIPAQKSVITQIFPDFYIAQTQSQFAQYFASLIISKVALKSASGVPIPAYNINVTTNSGAKISLNVPY